MCLKKVIMYRTHNSYFKSDLKFYLKSDLKIGVGDLKKVICNLYSNY